jgi:hypothetical protein
MREKIALSTANERIVGWYTATLDRRLRINGIISTNSESGNTKEDDLVPQWPWILSQVAFFKAYDDRIVLFLRKTLTRVVSDYQKTPRDACIFDAFVVPPFTGDWMVEKFWEWELLMRNVIAFNPNGPTKQADDDRNAEIS